MGAKRDVLRKSFDIGLDVMRRIIYKSISDFEQDLSKGVLHGAVDYVVYNPEPGFVETSSGEKAEPVRYAKTFALLSKENGLISVAAPSCRLIKERAALRRFELCTEKIYKEIAPYYDFIDIQAQSVQSNLSLNSQIVSHASKAIKSASPNTKVVAQNEFKSIH